LVFTSAVSAALSGESGASARIPSPAEMLASIREKGVFRVTPARDMPEASMPMSPVMSLTVSPLRSVNAMRRICRAMSAPRL